MPKFTVTALVGTKYRKTIEAKTPKDAEQQAFADIDRNSPGEEYGWTEIEVDTWLDVVPRSK